MKLSAPRRFRSICRVVSPGWAWLLVFGPALAYLLSTRLSSGFWSEVGEPAVRQLHVVRGFRSCHALAQVFYTVSDYCDDNDDGQGGGSSSSFTSTLKHPVQLVLSSGVDGVMDAIWCHDPDLDRGYLLLSESAGRGRLWRWEVGGGPIAIGKSLQLEDSGCRSSKCLLIDQQRHPKGSGALAIDFYQHGSPSEKSHCDGALVVAEWGEGRIVRLEENGARTPLLMHVPCPVLSPCSGSGDENNNDEDDDAKDDNYVCPLPRSERMVFTALGDLIVAVNYDDKYGATTTRAAPQCSAEKNSTEETTNVAMKAALIQLQHAAHVKALPSLRESRRAHEWTKVRHNHTVSVLYSSSSSSGGGGGGGGGGELLQLGGMTLPAAHVHSVLVMAVVRNDSSNRVLLMDVPTGRIDEDDEAFLLKDDDEELQETLQKEPTIVLDVTEYTQQAGALAVSQSGTFFIATDDAVLIANRHEGVVGQLAIGERPTAIVVGEDGYLYIATAHKLYRIRTKEIPVKLPTNKVARPPKSLVS